MAAAIRELVSCGLFLYRDGHPYTYEELRLHTQFKNTFVGIKTNFDTKQI